VEKVVEEHYSYVSPVWIRDENNEASTGRTHFTTGLGSSKTGS
jgi:hypothetical protein